MEIRDSAHLAGHRLDPFTLFNFSGTEALLVSPGRTQGDSVSKVAMRRLEDLDLFRVIDRSEKGFTFDLVDDVSDRLEEMRVEVGLPSRMGELEASVLRRLRGSRPRRRRRPLRPASGTTGGRERSAGRHSHTE